MVETAIYLAPGPECEKDLKTYIALAHDIFALNFKDVLLLKITSRRTLIIGVGLCSGFK